jgi:hypothetical protein
LHRHAFFSPLSNDGDRASTIQHFAQVTTVLRPHVDSATPQDTQAETNSSRWPRVSQSYCVYTRKKGDATITGVMTFGLSNPYQTTFYFAIGIGIEILLEAPSTQARLAGKDGVVTGASISESWMFAIVHEIAHQCFALGLQIRQLLEKVMELFLSLSPLSPLSPLSFSLFLSHFLILLSLSLYLAQLHLLSVEIAAVTLPAEFLDPETGRCCVLLGHLGDPDVPRGFNVTVPHQQLWIVQSVLFVPARLLSFQECKLIRKDGAGRNFASSVSLSCASRSHFDSSCSRTMLSG